jgi:hypothetical protein
METMIMHQTEEAPSVNSVYPDGNFPDLSKRYCQNVVQKMKAVTTCRRRQVVIHSKNRQPEG